jgi:conjugal transfer ATP-binding protein TraC
MVDQDQNPVENVAVSPEPVAPVEVVSAPVPAAAEPVVLPVEAVSDPVPVLAVTVPTVLAQPEPVAAVPASAEGALPVEDQSSEVAEPVVAEAPKKGLLGKWNARVAANKAKGAAAKTTKEATIASGSEKEGVKNTIDNPPKGADGKADYTKLSPEEKKKMIEGEKIFQEGLASIRDLIAPSSMEVSFNHLLVDGMFSQSFFVYTYPRYIETNWLSPIVNFDVTLDMSQFIYPIPSDKIMRVLKSQVARFNSSIRMANDKGRVRDPALETALEDAESLRTDLQRGQEKFFQFGLYFTIYHEDMKQLEKVTKQLESLLGGKLVLSRRADLRMEHAFTSTLPIALDELEVHHNMNTSPLSSTFPFISSELTSNDGILYGLNRHNDGLIIFDRFSLENANSVVFAKSGAGKSYAIKLEILRSLMMGADVIIIDPENEYEALAQTVGGTYMKVSLNSDRRINPFDLPKPLETDELKPGDLLRSAIIDLTGLMKLMLGDLTASEEALVDKALIDTYATKGITMDVPDPSLFETPTMNDFHSVLSSMDGTSEISQRVEKFTTGTFSGIFNQQTNIEMDNQLIVFSIRDLEDSLRPIAMYIILNYIWNRVRSKLKKRMLVIDEAWSMMQHEDSAKFLFGLVKRARKYFLGVTTITQDVEDFVKSPYGKPIITNSSMQLLLKQSPAVMESLGKIFNLTQGEKYMLLNSGVGQGLFFAGLNHVAIQIIASYTEDKIVTTNPQEMLAKQGEEVSSANVTEVKASV